MTAFHCAKRAGGASTTVGFEYGPYQRDHSLPGSSVLPERTKNSRRGSVEADFVFWAVGGGLHQSMRPHFEKRPASKARDAPVPAGSYSGPTEKTLPGLAVHKKILPLGPRVMPVICAEPAFA